MLDSNINSMPEDVISSIKAMHHDFDVAKPITNHGLFGFQYCSAIAKMFPRAKIFNCFRNPIDNLLAIYKAYLGTENPWAYDLDAIVDYFDFYCQIMAYHQASTPAAIIQLDMDAIRADPRVAIPNLVETCGFEWSDAYLGLEILSQCDRPWGSPMDCDGLTSENQSPWLTRPQLVAALTEKLNSKGRLPVNWV